MKQHQKHVKLARPGFGEFARTEWAILGAPCGLIQSMAKTIAEHFGKDYRLAYVDADHASGDAEEKPADLMAGTFLTYTDKIHFQRLDTFRNWNKYERPQLFNEQDLVLINGNHFPGNRQIVIIHPKKGDSLRRKQDRLTDVRLIILAEGAEEVPEWLQDHLENQVPVIRLSATERLLQFIGEDLQKAVAPLHGLVLAGGKSQRMGKDKGAIDYHGKAQRIHLYELLQHFCSEVFLSGRSEQIAEWQKDYPCLPDTFTGLGPFGAILSAMRHNPRAAWLTVACDLPLLDQASLDFLVSQRHPSKIATAFYNPATDFPEPLITIWEPRAYPVLLHYLSIGYSCPRKVLINSDIQIVKLPDAQVLKNVNSPEEYEEVLKLLS